MSGDKPEVGVKMATLGFDTNLHDVGSGKHTPVLLLHGSGPGVTAWANWRLVIPVLAKDRRVIAPDMLGFGYTTSPADARYCMDNWVAQVIAVLDGLAIDSVDVVGNSFGGALALALSLRQPGRIRRLVLMGSVGVRFELTPGLDQVWGYQPSIEGMQELLKLFAYDHSIITEDLVAMRHRASTRDDVQQRFAAMFPAPRQRWVDSLAQEDSALKSIAAPTLIIHGRDDRVIPSAVSVRLAALLPNSQLQIIPRCGHWVQIEQREIFLGLLLEFLNGDPSHNHEHARTIQ